MTTEPPATGQPQPDPWAAWPASLPRDGSRGAAHFRPGTEDGCPYLAMTFCTKCGWAQPLLCWCCAQFGLTADAVDAAKRLCRRCLNSTPAACKKRHMAHALAEAADA